MYVHIYVLIVYSSNPVSPMHSKLIKLGSAMIIRSNIILFLMTIVISRVVFLVERHLILQEELSLLLIHTFILIGTHRETVLNSVISPTSEVDLIHFNLVAI